MDPFSLIAMGVGAAGSLAGGIYNAATLDDRKEEWIKKQRQRAKDEYLLGDKWYDQLNPGIIPKGHLRAVVGDRRMREQADEQFQFDPMSFVPFVQNATQLAGGIYDAAGGGQPEQPLVDPAERAQAYAWFRSQGDEPFRSPVRR